MNMLQQLTFDFIQELCVEKRPRRETPLAVRRVAQRGNITLSHATAWCRANGIGGKEVI